MRVERNWVVLDATDVPLGRLSQLDCNSMLRVKNSNIHQTLIQVINEVIIINAEKSEINVVATDKNTTSLRLPRWYLANNWSTLRLE